MLHHPQEKILEKITELHKAKLQTSCGISLVLYMKRLSKESRYLEFFQNDAALPLDHVPRHLDGLYRWKCQAKLQQQLRHRYLPSMQQQYHALVAVVVINAASKYALDVVADVVAYRDGLRQLQSSR